MPLFFYQRWINNWGETILRGYCPLWQLQQRGLLPRGVTLAPVTGSDHHAHVHQFVYTLFGALSDRPVWLPAGQEPSDPSAPPACFEKAVVCGQAARTGAPTYDAMQVTGRWGEWDYLWGKAASV